jgi:hypothetical protein
MNRRSVCVAIASGSLLLSACSPDVTTPDNLAATPHAPAFAVGVTQPLDHVVLFRNGASTAKAVAEIAKLGGKITYLHEGIGFALVSGLSDAAASSLSTSNTVQQVMRDTEYKLDAPVAALHEELPADAIASQLNPAGAVLYSRQWNMRLIGANTAWAAGKLGSPSVTVAIIDSGLDYDNRDLTGLVDLSRSTSFVPSDDSVVTTFFPTRNVIEDFNGHGTNVATQVSSKAFAFAGVTSRTTLIGVKVLGWNGAGNTGRTFAGLLWAADHGANIANVSIGGGFAKSEARGFNSLFNRVFAYIKQKGMLVVVAAGNDGSDLDRDGDFYQTYCSAVHVVCVSAVGPKTAMLNQDEPAFYTNFGRSAISVAAPGGNADAANGFPASARLWGNDIASWVFSFCARRTLSGFTAAKAPILAGCQSGSFVTGAIGTSQASPHVAGLAALLMAEGLNAGSTKNAIMSSADDLGQIGNDPFYGRGRINVAKALGL